MAAAGVAIFCGKVASGDFRWKTTSRSLGVSTVSMLLSSETGPFSKLMARARSMENLTSWAVSALPLENFRPLRRVQRNCSLLRSPKEHFSAASATGAVPERGSRSRVWKVLWRTFQAPMSYAAAGSKGAGASVVSSNRSVVPTTMAPPPEPSPPPQATSTGASRPATTGRTIVLRFIVWGSPCGAFGARTLPIPDVLVIRAAVKFSRKD